MKSLKFKTILLALLTGLVFTSCNTKSEDQITRTAIVQAQMDGSFIDIAGTKLIPTNPVYSIESNMVYIFCQLNEQPPADAKSISITLLAAPVEIDAKSHVVDAPGASNDIPGDSSIITLNVSDYQTYNPYFYNQRTLILPIAFFLKNGLSSSTITEEIAKHKFELVYYANSATAGNTEMNIYLRQTVGDPQTSRDRVKTWSYMAYNINEMVERFKLANGGSSPTRIVIHTKENTSSDKLSDAEDATYPLEYTFNQ